MKAISRKLYFLIFVVQILPGLLHANGIATATNAREQAALGEFQNAYKLSTRALVDIKNEFGSDHQYVAFVLDDLARFGYQLGQYKQALQHARQARSIGDSSLRTDSPEYISILNNQAAIQIAIGDYSAAKAIYEWIYNLQQSRGTGTTEFASASANLAKVYTELQQSEQATQLLKGAYKTIAKNEGRSSSLALTTQLDLAESLLFSEGATSHPHPAHDIAVAVAKNTDNDRLTNRARLIEARALAQTSRLNEASQVLSQLIRNRHQVTPLEQASALYNMAGISILRGDVAAAENYSNRALDQYQTSVSAEHPAIGRVLYLLALVAGNKGDFDGSDNYYQRAIGLTEKSYGVGSTQSQMMRLERVQLLSENGRQNEALGIAKKVLNNLEQAGNTRSHEYFRALASMGLTYEEMGDQPNSVISYCDKALKLLTAIRGSDSTDAPPCHMAMGEAYIANGKTKQAIKALTSAADISSKNGAITAVRLGRALTLKAKAYSNAGNCRTALREAQSAFDALNSSVTNSQQSGTNYTRAIKERSVADELIEVLSNCSKGDQHAEISYKTTQIGLLRSSAAAAAKTAARLTPDESSLRALIKEKQNTESSLAVVSRELEEQWTAVQPNRSNLRALGDKRVALSASLERLSAKIAKQFPDYNNLVNPAPTTLAATQKALDSDEALIMQFTEGRSTHLWVVTSSDIKLITQPLSKSALAASVRNLRCTLYVDKFQAKLEGCEHKGAMPKPLDTQAAHNLYQALIQPAKHMLQRVDHLYLVLDGPMQRIPPSVLLTQPYNGSGSIDYQQLSYLNTDFSMSILPSPGTLVTLKNRPVTVITGNSFAGFGDPDFNAAGSSINRNVKGLYSRMSALPNTANEVLSIARLLGTDTRDVFLGNRATENVVKSLDLSNKNILAFATHGLTTEETKGVGNEPALVMTPPKNPKNSEDDGLLKASEIANLNLNADWVLLSACNTASSAAGASADGLSGLARSFFYAGAQGMLISHWAVETTTTEQLMENTIRYYTSKSPRAEALQNAMYDFYEPNARSAKTAHPGYWSAFVHVGLR